VSASSNEVSDRNPGVTGDAVKKASGRNWDEWRSYLDSMGAAELDHKGIVALLRAEPGVPGEWWCQTIAVGYEKLTGRRVLGQTAHAGFQVGVRRTLQAPVDRIWAILTSPEGLPTWLGDPVEWRLEEGTRYRLRDGTTGEIRVLRPNQRARLTFHPPRWQRPSTIQIRLDPADGRTVVSFDEERLPGSHERAERRAHFTAALNAIDIMARND